MGSWKSKPKDDGTPDRKLPMRTRLRMLMGGTAPQLFTSTAVSLADLADGNIPQYAELGVNHPSFGSSYNLGWKQDRSQETDQIGEIVKPHVTTSSKSILYQTISATNSDSFTKPEVTQTKAEFLPPHAIDPKWRRKSLSRQARNDVILEWLAKSKGGTTFEDSHSISGVSTHFRQTSSSSDSKNVNYPSIPRLNRRLLHKRSAKPVKSRIPVHIERLSQQQKRAIAQRVRINKMNVATHSKKLKGVILVNPGGAEDAGRLLSKRKSKNAAAHVKPSDFVRVPTGTPSTRGAAFSLASTDQPRVMSARIGQGKTSSNAVRVAIKKRPTNSRIGKVNRYVQVGVKTKSRHLPIPAFNPRAVEDVLEPRPINHESHELSRRYSPNPGYLSVTSSKKHFSPSRGSVPRLKPDLRNGSIHSDVAQIKFTSSDQQSVDWHLQWPIDSATTAVPPPVPPRSRKPSRKRSKKRN